MREERLKSLSRGGFMRKLDIISQPNVKKDYKASVPYDQLKFTSGSGHNSNRDRDEDNPEQQQQEESNSDRSSNSRVEISRTYNPTIYNQQADIINEEIQK